MTISHRLALQLLSKGYKEKYETLVKESPVNLMRLAELNKEHQQIFDGIKVQISAQKKLRDKLAKLKTGEDRSTKVLEVLTEKPSPKDLESPEKILEFLEDRTTALRDIYRGIVSNKPINENVDLIRDKIAVRLGELGQDKGLARGMARAVTHLLVDDEFKEYEGFKGMKPSGKTNLSANDIAFEKELRATLKEHFALVKELKEKFPDEKSRNVDEVINYLIEKQKNPIEASSEASKPEEAGSLKETPHESVVAPQVSMQETQKAAPKRDDAEIDKQIGVKVSGSSLQGVVGDAAHLAIFNVLNLKESYNPNAFDANQNVMNHFFPKYLQLRKALTDKFPNPTVDNLPEMIKTLEELVNKNPDMRHY